MNPTINRMQVGEILVVQRFGAPVDIENLCGVEWIIMKYIETQNIMFLEH